MRRTAIEYYAGLDVWPKEVSICVVDDGGRVVVRRSAMASHDTIQRFLQDRGIAPSQIVHESGQLAIWLHLHLERPREGRAVA